MKEGVPIEKKTVKSKQASGFSMLKNFMAGDVLSSSLIDKHLNFILYIVFIVILYIGNSHQARILENEMQKMDKEIKELQAEFISIHTVLIEKSRLPNVIKQVKKQDLGLKESKTPPYTLSAYGH